MYEVLKWIVIALSVFSAPMLIWLFISMIPGFLPEKRAEKTEEKMHRFAVLICARNEEAVIGHLLDSLKEQDYPQENYCVFVVADNCTDHTACAAAAHGAVVMERCNPLEKGKGYALGFGIKQLQKDYEGRFDAVCVFDADNLVSGSFLKEMNEALCTGADVALGYRDTKNIHDSWISEAYSIYWLMLLRFYHMSRHRMGMSSMVGGTGFALKLSALENGAWETYTLTEDVEFSIQQICKGNTIVPARRAVFYDEQPSRFGVSVKQRFRWMAGGMQCIPRYLKTILKTIGGGGRQGWDLLWYLFFIPATGLTIPLNVCGAAVILENPLLQPFSVLLIAGGILGNVIFAMVIAALTLKLEKRKVRPMLRGILLYPVFLFTMMCVAFAALCRPKTEWVPIAHQSAYTIEEMKTRKN